MTATAIAEDEVRPRSKLPRLLVGVAAVDSLAEIQEMWEREADRAGKEV